MVKKLTHSLLTVTNILLDDKFIKDEFIFRYINLLLFHSLFKNKSISLKTNKSKKKTRNSKSRNSKTRNSNKSKSSKKSRTCCLNGGANTGQIVALNNINSTNSNISYNATLNLVEDNEMLREEIDELKKKVNILAEILLEKKSLEKEDESLNKFNYFTILCSVFVCCMCLFMLYVSYQNIDDTLGKWDINLEFQDLYNYIIKNDKSAILQNVNAATTNIIDGIKESMQKTLDNRNSNAEFSLKKMISAIPRYLTSQTIFGTALSDSKILLKNNKLLYKEQLKIQQEMLN